MIFITHSNILVNCKVATFIRLPVVSKRKCFDVNSSVTVKEHVVSDLFTCEHGDYRTMFYVSGDTIRFNNHQIEKYRGMNLIPLFDHKSKAYNLLIINPQQYIGISSMFVKVPNGDLYAVFKHYSIKTHNYKYIKYYLLAINNLTKGKEIFRYEGENPGQLMRRDDQNLFPTFSYTKPLYNSFVIIMRIDTHNKLEKNCIYILDLLEDTVKEVSYDLKNYIKKHIDNFVYSLKENHEIIVEADNIFVNPSIVLNHSLTPYTPISIYEEIPDSDCKLIKYKNKIPIYSQCESTFLLQLESIASHRTMQQQNESETKLSCSLVIQFSAYIENNELNVLLTCKKIQINVSTVVYNMPLDDILLYEKYPINNIYNISESRLYSIDAFFDDYVLKNRDIYHWDGDSYKLAYKLSNANINILKRRGMRFITIKNQSVLAIIQPTLAKKDQNYVNIGDNYIVDLSKIKEMINTYKEQNKQVLIIDVNKYIKRISIKDLVTHIVKKIRNRRTKCKSKLYKSYISTKAGILYIFIVLRCILLKGKKIQRETLHTRFAIVKHNIRGNALLIKILFLSNPYSSTFAIKRILLNEILNKIKNKNDRNVHFLDFLNNLNNNSTNENEILYLYEEELMVRHKITTDNIRHVVSIMEFKDIKYNRKFELRFKSESNSVINSRDRITIKPSINHYDDIVIHSFDIKIITRGADKHFNYKDVVIFSAINLIYARLDQIA